TVAVVVGLSLDKMPVENVRGAAAPRRLEEPPLRGLEHRALKWLPLLVLQLDAMPAVLGPAAIGCVRRHEPRGHLPRPPVGDVHAEKLAVMPVLAVDDLVE